MPTTSTQPDDDEGATRDRRYWLNRVTDPRSPVGRSKLGELIDFDHRTTERHRTIWKFHLSWAHKRYGWTSLASVRTIREVLLGRSPTGKALSTRLINEANRELVEFGYLIELEKGSGHRGTRFALNWDLLNQASKGQFPFSVPPVGDANSVSPTGHSDVSPTGNAKPCSVPPVGHKDPTTPTRLPTGLGVVDASGDAGGVPSPTPPHHTPDGVDGDGAPGLSFEELWDLWGGGPDSALAELEFDKVKGDSALLEKIMAAAIAWRSVYDEARTVPQYRKTLRKWLAEKRWRDTPKVRRSDLAAAQVEPAPSPTSVRLTPTPQHCRILSATVRDGDEGSVLSLALEPITGGDSIVRHLRHETYERHELEALLTATGLPAGADSDELEGCEVVVDGRWYWPVPAND